VTTHKFTDIHRLVNSMLYNRISRFDCVNPFSSRQETDQHNLHEMAQSHVISVISKIFGICITVGHARPPKCDYAQNCSRSGRSKDYKIL
jgi:hypothetical protein